MGRLHAYTNRDSLYLRVRPENRPQTLQMNSPVADLLADLGYEPDDPIPRDVTKPLVITGLLHTKSGGLTTAELLDAYPRLAPTRCPLTADQRETLQQFLDRFVPAYSRTQHDRLNEFLEVESPLSPIEWTDGKVKPDELIRELQEVARDLRGEERELSPTEATETNSDPSVVEKSPGTTVISGAIPHELRRVEQWIGWRTTERDGNETKVPLDPHTGGYASVNDPDTWASFDVALDAAGQETDTGLGFVFTSNDTFAGVDLDDIRDSETGDLTVEARDIVQRLDTYTEISPSGEGLHAILHGFTPDGRIRHDGVELYDRQRFFTVTGAQLADYPASVEVRHDELGVVHAKYIARSEDDTGGTAADTELSTVDADIEPETVLERAKRSETFRRLWRGDTTGYPSHSEADMALCCSLAYRTSDDLGLMDELFRRSGLMREKWDERRGEQTYGELTLRKATQFVHDHDPYLERTDRTALHRRDIADLESETAATVEAEVTSVRTHPAEVVFQDGRLNDGTASIRFVTWEETTDRESVRLEAYSRFRLRNVWITEHDGHLEIHLNEHTSVEQLSPRSNEREGN